MPALNPTDVRKKLASKFGFVHAGGTRHDTYKLYLDGDLRATVQVERHPGDIGPNLYSKMALQLTVRANQFLEMIRCTISRDQYLDETGYEAATDPVLSQSETPELSQPPSPELLPAKETST